MSRSPYRPSVAPIRKDAPDPVDDKVTSWLKAEQRNNQLLREELQKSMSEAKAPVAESPLESPITIDAITNFFAGLKQQADEIVSEISAVLATEGAARKKEVGDAFDTSASVASTLLTRNFHQGHAVMKTHSENSSVTRSSASSYGKHSSSSGRLAHKGQREVLDTMMLSASKREEVQLARLNRELAGKQQILDISSQKSKGEIHSKQNGTWGNQARVAPIRMDGKQGTKPPALFSRPDGMKNSRKDMMATKDGELGGSSHVPRSITF
jgi:hypothetical protein